MSPWEIPVISKAKLKLPNFKFPKFDLKGLFRKKPAAPIDPAAPAAVPPRPKGQGLKNVFSRFTDPQKRKKLLTRKVLFPALIAIFGLVLLAGFAKDRIGWVGGFPVLQSKKKKVEEEKKPVETPMPVKVYKVAKVSFRDTLPSLGTIKGFRELDLKFATPGNIEYINFKEGERITQGDIIASLDQREPLLKLEYAKIEMEKQAKLLELGSIVESKAKQSSLEYQSAKAELDKTNLVALADGYIGSIEVDKGSYVTPQDKIGTFVDVKDVFVEFGVIEKDVAKVKEGQNVEVTVESFADQIFKGQLESISPLVEGRSRTVKIKAKLTNADEKIKPGMFGRVNVLVYEKEQALVIPSSAFKKKDDVYNVFLVHPEEAPAAVEKPAEDPNAKKTKKGGLKALFSFGKKKPEAPKAAGPTAPGSPEAPANDEHGHSPDAHGPAGGPPGGESPEEPKAQFGTIEIRPIEIAYATPDAVELKEGLDEGDLIVMDTEQDLQDKAKVEITETQEGIF